MRRMSLIVAALAFAAPALAQEEPGPGVAIGDVTQTWNRVDVDYGVGDPATTELHVLAPDGRTIVVDRNTALQGTLHWDRKIDNHHVAPGRYVLEVVATAASGTNTARVRVNLGLVYVDTKPKTTRGRVVLKYALAETARVRLFVRRVGTRRFVLAERRLGLRGHNHITWTFQIRGRHVPAGRYQLLLRAVSLPA